MAFDRMHADHEIYRDFVVGLSSSQEPKHLCLAVGQAVRPTATRLPARPGGLRRGRAFRAPAIGERFLGGVPGGATTNQPPFYANKSEGVALLCCPPLASLHAQQEDGRF